MNPLLSIRKCSEFFCAFATAAFAIYALVIAISSFNSSSSSKASTCSAAHGCDGCDKDYLHDLISILVRCLASAQTCSLLLIYFVRAIMEGAREAHERVAKDEDADFKAAQDAHMEASGRLEKVRRKLDYYSKGEGVRQQLDDDELWADLVVTMQQEEKKLKAEVELARQKEDQKKPKEGMERLTGWWGKAVRVSFCLSVIFSQLAGVIAGFAFYCSLQIQQNCKFGGFLEVLVFAVALGFSLVFHVFFGWVSITQR